MTRLRVLSVATVVTMLAVTMLAAGGGISANPAQASALQWQQQVMPSVLGGLSGVSCPTGNSCVAVGARSGARYPEEAFAETWDGSTWAVDPTPLPTGTTSALSSVSCISLTSCVAVGTTGNEPYPMAKVHPFSEVLRGAKWEIVPTATLFAGAVASLGSVSCWAANSCIAVGGYTGGATSGTLAEIFNGSSWMLDKTPGLAGGSLSSISCLPATVPALCNAVGSAGVGSKVKALVEHVNGGSFQVLNVAAPAGVFLNSVSCPQPTSCVAVGNGKGGTFSEVDDLNKWTTVAMPKLFTPYVSLSGVSCPVTIDACEADGYFFGGPSTSAMPTEAFNGRRWAVQPSHSIASGPQIFGVSCSPAPAPAAAGCTAVGRFTAPTGSGALALRYAAGAAVTSSASAHSAAGAAQVLAYAHGVGQAVYVVSTAGGPPKALPVVSSEQPPSWSPNGKELAFGDTQGCQNCDEIDIAPENGQSSFQLTTSGVNANPTWSPNGALIAYSSSPSVTSTVGYIDVVSPQGNGQRRLVGALPGGAAVNGPAVWSPNSSELAVSAFGGGSEGTTGRGIYLVGEDGKGLHRVTTGNDSDPVWSPDGTKIAFARQTPLPEKTSRTDIYVVNANGTGLHRLVGGATESISPSWSPTGSQIAFAGSTAAEVFAALYVVNANGTGLRQLTPHQDVINPTWSPNGAFIAFTEQHGGPLSQSNGWDVDVVPSSGGAERNLSGAVYGEADTYLVWQP